MGGEDAAARKSRLKRMREEAEATEAAEAAPQEPALKFRNYNPRNQKLDHSETAQPVVEVFEPEPVEPQEYNPDDNEELLINVAPRKPNWDLRRDINKKLEKLERRTQRALIEIMQEEERKRGDEERERLEAEGGVRD